MTNYLRLRAPLVTSIHSDYGKPFQDELLEYTLSPTELMRLQVSAATTGTTIDLSTFTTINAIVIANLDTTNFVRAVAYDVVGSQAPTAGGVTIANAGTDDTITDVDANGTMGTNGSLAGRYVRVVDSVADDGTYLIQATTTDAITLTSAGAMTGEVAGAITLHFESKHDLKLPTESHAVLYNIAPEEDLVLTADTAACTCDIFVYGA